METCKVCGNRLTGKDEGLYMPIYYPYPLIDLAFKPRFSIAHNDCITRAYKSYRPPSASNNPMNKGLAPYQKDAR